MKTWFEQAISELHKKRQGIGSFVISSPCFNTMPWRHTPLLVHFRQSYRQVPPLLHPPRHSRLRGAGARALASALARLTSRSGGGGGEFWPVRITKESAGRDSLSLNFSGTPNGPRNSIPEKNTIVPSRLYGPVRETSFGFLLASGKNNEQRPLPSEWLQAASQRQP